MRVKVSECESARAREDLAYSPVRRHLNGRRLPCSADGWWGGSIEGWSATPDKAAGEQKRARQRLDLEIADLEITDGALASRERRTQGGGDDVGHRQPPRFGASQSGPRHQEESLAASAAGCQSAWALPASQARVAMENVAGREEYAGHNGSNGLATKGSSSMGSEAEMQTSARYKVSLPPQQSATPISLRACPFSFSRLVTSTQLRC